MLGTKWLGQIIEEENIELGTNTLIVAPCGSGKTTYIFNTLCKDKKALYLCDTNNLKYSVNHDITKRKNRGELIDTVTMSYHKFGTLIKNDTANKYINSFDYVICDEAHNLINYQGFSNDPSLIVAQIKLFDKYENTKIVMFTATPEPLDKLVYKNNGIDCNFKAYDFREGYDIKQYANLREAYIGHFSDIEKQLYEYKDYFALGGQCLIFTQTIEKIIELGYLCKKLGLKPMGIWSENNEDYPMNERQLEARKHLLENQELMSDYNVLIINRSSETGINIENWSKEVKPHRMNLMIIHALDKVQQEQARGRVRHDLELLILQTKDTKRIGFEMDDDILDEWWEKDIIQEFVIVKNNLRDGKSRLIGMKALPKRLEEFGYSMESKKVTHTDKATKKRKQTTLYRITKVN